MKLLAHFKTFLDEMVNLDATRLARLSGSVESIATYLESSSTFESNFIDLIPQGSYAHKTIIKPVQSNDEFDADVLLYLEEFEGWEAEDYVQKLYEQFRTSGVYKEKVSRRTRCVTIDYAGDFHIDVVPYLERHSNKYITNRVENGFELTDPEGYNAWLDDKNKTAGRNLVKVIRLLKYLRDFKNTFSVKSVLLNVLIGNQVNDAALLEDSSCYSDVPTTLRTLTLKLKEYVEANSIMPTIEDPSGTGENLGDRWDQESYTIFRSAMIRYAEWIDDAWSENDKDKCLAKWQRVFGDQFGKASLKVATALMTQSAQIVPFRKTEQFLTKDFGIPLSVDARYRFRIEGRVTRDGTFGAYYLSDRGNRVLRHRRIEFRVAVCNVPEPFDIYWKVSNRGDLAESRDMVRGQIEKGGRVWRIRESTDFIGPHFVEAYVVKNGVCVAKDRQDVIIFGK